MVVAELPNNTYSVINLGATNPNLSQTASNLGSTMKRVTLRQKLVTAKKTIGE